MSTTTTIQSTSTKRRKTRDTLFRLTRPPPRFFLKRFSLVLFVRIPARKSLDFFAFAQRYFAIRFCERDRQMTDDRDKKKHKKKVDEKRRRSFQIERKKRQRQNEKKRAKNMNE